jgi:hypothetical protein
MAKVLVKFRTGYSRYNKGETAAFEAAKAEQLCAGKNPVAQVVGAVKGAAEQSSDGIDLLGLERQELVLAGENLGEQLADLERREEGLVHAMAFCDERARELTARELTIAKREKAIETAPISGAEKEPAAKVESQPAAPVEGVTEAKDKAPGAPPKQGAKS